MTGMITSLLMTLCSNDAWCISEVGVLEPKTTTEVIRYVDAVKWRNDASYSCSYGQLTGCREMVASISNCMIKNLKPHRYCHDKYYAKKK